MQFGRCFEEFEIGDIYKHWPGRTITEYDDTLFSMLRCHLDSCVMVWSKSDSAFFVPKAQSESDLF